MMTTNLRDERIMKYLYLPSYRLLEEGDLDGAEKLKLQLEQAQRDRRKRFEELGIHHEPKWFK